MKQQHGYLTGIFSVKNVKNTNLKKMSNSYSTYTSAATADIVSIAVHSPKSQISYEKNLWAAWNQYYLNVANAIKRCRRWKDNFNDTVKYKTVQHQMTGW
jgi:hypothetical protein